MKKSQKTKRYIIEKTAEIFNKKGYIATSLSDLTDATNLTKGSIYGNFKNKEEVAVAAFNFNYQRLIKKFTSRMSRESSSVGKLNAFLDIYEESFKELVDLGGCPILNNAVDSDDTHEHLLSLSVKAFNDWNHNIASIIRKGIADKEIYASINADSYADLFLINIEGGLLLAKSTGERHYFDHAIRHLRTIVSESF
jgi:AcrR family transcriptional regulator